MAEITVLPSPFHPSHDLWEITRALGPFELPSSSYNDPVARGRLPWFKKALDREQITAAHLERYVDFHALEQAAHARWPHGPVRTERLLVNVMGPMKQLPPHVDPPTFDGVTSWAHASTGESGFSGPRTLLGVMSRSGLFERWRAHTISAVLWGAFDGGGDYLIWPTGIQGRPIRIPASAHYCVLADNQRLFHAFDDVGSASEHNAIPVLDRSSTLSIRDDQVTISGDHPTYSGTAGHTFRTSAVWQARSTLPAHTHPLALEQVVQTFAGDLRHRGIEAPPSSDPLLDRKWLRILLREYGF